MFKIDEIFDSLAFVALVAVAFVALRGVAVHFPHVTALAWIR